MVTVQWKGGRAFEATPPTGNRFVMDAYPDSGGQNLGPTPLEAFLAAAAACTAMDVVSILEKKRQKVTAYQVEIDGERSEPGVYPRPYVSMTIRHIVEGEDVDPEAVDRAVALSEEKYCTVVATLHAHPEVRSLIEIRSRNPSAV